MSFRYSYNTSSKVCRKRSDESTSTFTATSGERAWDYLLRRKAEDINDRIHKTKTVEFTDETTQEPSWCNAKIKKERIDPETDEQDGDFTLHLIPQEVSGSQNYTTSRGFWNDTAKEWFDKEMPVRVKSKFVDDHETNSVRSHYCELETPWRQPKVESQCASDLGHTSKQGYSRNAAANHISEEALITNVSNYVENARHAAKQNYRSNASANNPLKHNMDAPLAAKQSYGRNASEQTLSHIVPRDTKDAYTMQNAKRNAPDQTFVHSMSNHNKDPCYSTKNSYQSSHTCTSSQVSYPHAPNHTKDIYHWYSTGQSYGREIADQTLVRNGPNDDKDLRHLIKKNPERDPSDLPFDPTLIHNRPESVEGASDAAELRCKQIITGNRTLVHSLPYPAEGVEVVYTADPVEAEAWLRNNVIDCSATAVGFDIEWKPQFVSKRKGGKENKTAVLQLAVESSCLVLHLHKMQSQPKLLRFVLNNKKILKVGSGILQDVTKLKQDTGLKCSGFVDTQKMANTVGLRTSQKLGLKALAERFLGIKLDKPKSVSKSNWEKFPLTIRQIHYAALDAWIGLKIYQHMKSMNGDAHKGQDESCNPVKIMPCHVCNKKVKGEVALVQHIKIHAKCKCGKFFQSKISKSHKRECPVLKADKQVHVHVCSKLAPAVLVDDAEPGLCQGCSKRCKTAENLMEHIREVGHVTCPFCTRLLHSVASSSHIRKCRHFVSEEWKEFATDQVNS